MGFLVRVKLEVAVRPAVLEAWWDRAASHLPSLVIDGKPMPAVLRFCSLGCIKHAATDTFTVIAACPGLRDPLLDLIRGAVEFRGNLKLILVNAL